MITQLRETVRRGRPKQSTPRRIRAAAMLLPDLHERLFQDSCQKDLSVSRVLENIVKAFYSEADRNNAQ